MEDSPKMSQEPSGDTIRIRELDWDMLPPLTSKFEDPSYAGGAKYVFIGKPNTGKSSAIMSLLYFKKHIFPVGLVMNGSEDTNHMYAGVNGNGAFPSTFVYNEYSESKIEDVIKRQKIAKQHLSNPWAVLILDDCTDDPRIFNRVIQRSIFKRGRHMSLMYIVSLQYAMDIKADIRSSIDGTFIFREPIMKNRKRLYENYASIVPDYETFCYLMDNLTEDYHFIYIHNFGSSNEWTDCVFYGKAPLVSKNWKFGSPEYWEFHHKRYDPNHVETFI